MSTGTLTTIQPKVERQEPKGTRLTIEPKTVSVPPSVGVALDGSSVFAFQVHVTNTSGRPFAVTSGLMQDPDVTDEEETQAILADAGTMALLKKARAEKAAGQLLRDEDVRKPR